jgi:putative membrane protein
VARPAVRAGEHPFDPGLQPERTLLAWRRTYLALGVACLVGARLLPPIAGPASLALVGAALGVVVVIAIGAERAYRRIHSELTSDEPRHPGGGGLILAAAALTSVCAAAALAVVLLSPAVSR